MKKTISFFSALLFIGGGIFYYFFAQPPAYDIRFPIDFVPELGFPRTLVKIEDKPYRFFIDTGSSSWLSLERELLDQIQDKTFLRDDTITNANGEEHPAKAYRVPLAKIWYLQIKNSEITEVTPSVSLYDFSHPPRTEILDQRPGYIGRPVLNLLNWNWFMDFRNAAMFACSRLSDRKKDGYLLNKLLPVPFIVDDSHGYVLEVETDLGIKRFILDTASSHNLIKPSILGDKLPEDWIPGVQRYHSSKFILGGEDFGSTPFVLFELAPFIENLDGILGMDFFKEYVIYLDFEKKIAHIGKSSECLGEEGRAKLKEFDFHLPEGITLNN